jgi:hypothetical protein
MRSLTIRVCGLAVAIGLGGCFTGPAPVATGQAMRLSTLSLWFAAPSGGADPAPQAITVDDGGAGTLAVPATHITYRNGGGWLSATVSGSAPPYTIAVQATIGSLGPGSYVATIQVDSPGASNSPQDVSVTLTVGSSSQPTMLLSPSALTFQSSAGSAPAPQTVTVSNAGAGTLAPPIASVTYLGQERNWLDVTVSGSAAPYTLTVQPITAGIPARPNPNLASITVDCSGASNTPLAIAVQLTVH